MKVSGIQVKCLALDHPERLQSLILQKVNEPLDKYKVRESVQALYNTGRFAGIQVEAQRQAGGDVALLFDAKENYFFGSISVVGAPNPPTGTQLVGASKLALGEQLTSGKLEAAIQGMTRVLQENGYYAAKIVPSYFWDGPSQQVKVSFQIDKGRAARIGKVNVIGMPGLLDNEIRRISGIDAGDRVSSDSVAGALRRLRRKYQGLDRLLAEVSMTKREYHPQNNALDYTFDIVQGPLVIVKVEGAGLRQSQVKKLVPIYEENAVDDDLLNEGSRNLRDYFRGKGYFDTQVEVNQKRAPDRIAVTYTVQTNERHKLVERIAASRYLAKWRLSWKATITLTAKHCGSAWKYNRRGGFVCMVLSARQIWRVT